MEKADLIGKVAGFLRRTVSSSNPVKLRYFVIAMGIEEGDVKQLEEDIRENIVEAAAQAGVEIVEKDDRSALFKRPSAVEPPRERRLEES